MKISHKLIFGYLIIAILMGSLGYVSLKIYNDIKYRLIQLNVDSSSGSKLSDEILFALEESQKSAHDLFKKKYKIIYQPYERKPEEKEIIQAERTLKADLEKLAHILATTKRFSRISSNLSEMNEAIEIEELKQAESMEWLNLKKKRYFYHWKYISYFLHLAEQKPEQAYAFFEKNLEPHYRQNIVPIIDKFREDAQEEMQTQYRAIVEDYIPNADIIIIVSTIFTFLTVFFLGFLISRSVSRPIMKLTSAAVEIGKGQLDTQIDIKSKDEIGILAAAFNQMAYDLSRSTVSKSYVDNIIRSMLNSLIVVDPDGAISKVNESTLKLLDYTEKEVIGENIRKIIAEENTGSGSTIEDLISSGSIVNVEKTYLTKSGTRIPVLFSGAVMCDEDGINQGIVCVARDIIELKQAEIALNKAKDGLEHRVEERTAELLDTNKHLKREIEERRRTELALRESEEKLRLLSSQLLRAQEKERRRISLELHDELGQSLSLLKVQLSAIKRKLRKDQKELDEALQESRQNLNHVIENVRRLSRDLSPSILEDLGLFAAIEWLITDFAKHYNVSASYEPENIDDFFSTEHQIIIYRIFQEILTNIRKHAEASQVSVAIKKKNGGVLFTVQDNGKGFDFNEISGKNSTEKGMGLTAMHERVLIVGSSLDLWTQPGQGTKISFAIPLQ